MAGRPGVGGQNRIPAELHMLRGTYRPDRHGPDQAGSEPGPPREWHPSKADWAALDRPGRALLSGLRREFVIDFLTSRTVLEAARAADEVARLRAIDRSTVAGRALAAHERALRQWTALYIALLREIHLRVKA